MKKALSDFKKEVYIAYGLKNEVLYVGQGKQKTNFSSSRKKATHNAVEKLFTIKDEYSSIKLGGGM